MSSPNKRVKDRERALYQLRGEVEKEIAYTPPAMTVKISRLHMRKAALNTALQIFKERPDIVEEMLTRRTDVEV